MFGSTVSSTLPSRSSVFDFFILIHESEAAASHSPGAEKVKEAVPPSELKSKESVDTLIVPEGDGSLSSSPSCHEERNEQRGEKKREKFHFRIQCQVNRIRCNDGKIGADARTRCPRVRPVWFSLL